MMFIVSLIEFSKHVQNEISAKVMPKPQNFTADFADRTRSPAGPGNSRIGCLLMRWPGMRKDGGALAMKNLISCSTSWSPKCTGGQSRYS